MARQPFKLAVYGFLAAILFWGAFVLFGRYKQSQINSFESCLLAGQPILDSSPRQCAANGQVFIESKQE